MRTPYKYDLDFLLCGTTSALIETQGLIVLKKKKKLTNPGVSTSALRRKVLPY